MVAAARGLLSTWSSARLEIFKIRDDLRHTARCRRGPQPRRNFLRYEMTFGTRPVVDVVLGPAGTPSLAS